MFDAGKFGNVRNIPAMMHELQVEKANSILNVEFSYEGLHDQKILMLLDYERLPTYKRYQYAAIATELSGGTNTTVWDTDGGNTYKS